MTSPSSKTSSQQSDQTRSRDQSSINTPQNSDFFLPDFCQIQSLFLVLLIAELLAVIFTLLNLSPNGSLWNQLGLYSVSIQLICLFSVSILCLLRPYLARLNDWAAGGVSLFIILFLTFGYTLVVIYYYWLQPIDLTQNGQSYFVIKNLLIAGLIGAVALRYFYLLQQYRRQVSAESSARLEALQARIRPHFLFNSMNVIASLTRIDGRKAERAIEDLSDLFRATLNTSETLIPLREELENGRKYLALEQLRLAERLIVEENIEEASLDLNVPPLSIQPLLENAVYHGIQQIPEGGVVKISSLLAEGKLVLSVENPTMGNKKAKGHGIALANIAERLKVIYSGKGRLEKTHKDNYYQVKLIIPLMQEREN